MSTIEEKQNAMLEAMRMAHETNKSLHERVGFLTKELSEEREKTIQLQQELDAARDEIEEHVKNAEQWKRQYINEWANKKQVEKQLAEKEKELDAARADAKKNQIILDNLRDAPYWELEQKLAVAIAELERQSTEDMHHDCCDINPCRCNVGDILKTLALIKGT